MIVISHENSNIKLSQEIRFFGEIKNIHKTEIETKHILLVVLFAC